MKPSDVAINLAVLIKHRMPALLIGKPGVGKTDTVGQGCEAAKADLVVFHPAVSDPTSFEGLPWVIDGNAVFLPIGKLKQLVNAKRPTVALFDDLGQAKEAVQAACMQLFLARMIGDHKISPFVTFIGATNSREHRAGVIGMLEPVKSRFKTLIKFEADATDWISWGRRNGVDERMTMFIQSRPDLIDKFEPSLDLVNSPVPRTITNAAEFLPLDLPPQIKRDNIEGAVGEGFAHELYGFLEAVDAFANFDKLFTQPEDVNVDKDVSVQFAVASLIASRANEKNFHNILRAVARLQPDYQIVAVNAAIERTPALVNTRAYGTWEATRR